MGVSGIGTSSTYLYDATTGKLSTKDGTKNNFVDYFNGDSSEETLEDLNGFDKNNKYELQELFWLFRDGYIGKNVPKDDSGKYEITADRDFKFLYQRYKGFYSIQTGDLYR